ncbi:MAG: nucleoside deaminase [Terriglobia bacterium]
MRTVDPHAESSSSLARDQEFMRQAIRLARVALERGDTPVGSVVVYDGQVIGQGIEAVRLEKDLAAHAELKAVGEACRAIGSLDLSGCTLYTTVEPCWMCSFMIRTAHVSRVVTGRAVPHIGGISSKHPILLDPDIPNWPRPPAVTAGVLEKECKALFTG